MILLICFSFCCSPVFGFFFFFSWIRWTVWVFSPTVSWNSSNWTWDFSLHASNSWDNFLFSVPFLWCTFYEFMAHSLQGQEIFGVLLHSCVVSNPQNPCFLLSLHWSDFSEAFLKCPTFLCYLSIFKKEAPKVLGGFVWEWARSASRLHCRMIGHPGIFFGWVAGRLVPQCHICMFFSRAICLSQKKKIFWPPAWGQHHQGERAWETGLARQVGVQHLYFHVAPLPCLPLCPVCSGPKTLHCCTE